MSHKIRVSKKQMLKQPDEFITFSGKMIGFLKKNEKAALAAGVFLVLSILSASFFFYYVKTNETLAFNYLSTALESDKDMSKRKAELLKVKNIRFSSASDYASLYLAQIYEKENETDKAKTELNNAVKLKDTYFRGNAYLLMIDLLIKEKKYDEAMSLSQKAYEQSRSPIKDELLFKQAHIHELKNNQSEAKNIYMQLNKSNPDFYLSKLVQEKMGI